MKFKNVALTISILGVALGLGGWQENMFFWLALPTGAIAFIFFFITHVLENEFALLDQQILEAKNAQFNTETSGNSKRVTCAPALTTVVSP